MVNPKTWHRPVSADWPLGTPFGVPGSRWKSGYHTGDDFKTPRWTQVEAADEGEVTWIGDSGDGFGLHIRIEHEDGLKTYYCHLDEIFVRTGRKVVKGELIGLSGNSGNSSGPHLHFGVKDKDRKWIKPEYEV